MPRLNGRQCLVSLKSSDKLKAIPVIMYTTSKLKKDMDDTIRLGAATFLTKPTSLQDLKQSLKLIITTNTAITLIKQNKKTKL